MVNNSIDISVIIINYNTCQMTQECIDSIYKKTKEIAFEIILVDNASTDGSKEHFEKEETKGKIRYIYNFENMGFGRANNAGMKLSKGEYIFLLNSDTILVNNALKEFYDKVSKSSELAFYGSWLLNIKHEVIHSGAKIPTVGIILNHLLTVYSGKFGLQLTGDVDMKYTEEPEIETEYITGADLFFNRKVYEKTGGFDHNYFMYYEESDWQLSAKKIGIKSYLINGPQIIHLIGGSNKEKKWNEKIFSIHFCSCCYFIKKNFGFINYSLFRVFYFLLDLPLLLSSRTMSFSEKCSAIRILVKRLNALLVG